MIAVKHTPGPWIDERGGTISAEGKVIATVQMGLQHNARLIAAAPDLLAALRNLVDRIEANGGIGPYNGGPAFVMEPARAALAKAAT